MTTEAPRLPRRRRYLVRGLLAIGAVLALLSIFAVWANRQMLDANHWADTSSRLLRDHDIRQQVSQIVVDQVYANVDVQSEVADALPPRFKSLAGPAANGLRELAQQRMDRVLQRPRVEQLWETANRVTAQQFIDIAEGHSKAITRNGNAVILDLRPIVLELATRLGLPASTVDRIPADVAQVKIMQGDQVGFLQDAVAALQGLGVVLPALALVVLALAVYLSGPRRRETLLAVGLNLIAIGLLVLIVRRVGGGAVVNSLAKTDAVRPAVESTWAIGTRILQQISWATIVIGIPVVFAAWLAGPRRAAVGLRRWMAPTMRDRPGLAWSIFAVIVLLILAWGPIPATRMPVTILLIIGLSIWGFVLLRRQCIREFPDEVAGKTTAQVRARMSGAMRRTDGKSGEIERLAQLRDRGVLTDEEFAAQKAALLGSGGPAPAA
jgi:Short C-terminal domain